MECVICGKTKPPYKCPQCLSPFCCVKCSKAHKPQCNGPSSPPTADPTPTTAPSGTQPACVTDPADIPEIDAKCERIWQDARVKELLQYEGVSKLLKLIMEILTSPRLSGEQSSEGRQMVALKKIRELRKGGREANAAIEELVSTVSALWEQLYKM